jgi:hypothetical protein
MAQIDRIEGVVKRDDHCFLPSLTFELNPGLHERDLRAVADVVRCVCEAAVEAAIARVAEQLALQDELCVRMRGQGLLVHAEERRFDEGETARAAARRDSTEEGEQLVERPRYGHDWDDMLDFVGFPEDQVLGNRKVVLLELEARDFYAIEHVHRVKDTAFPRNDWKARSITTV